MAKIKSITVSSGLKISKNYSVAESHVSLTADLEEGDSEDAVHANLSSAIQQMIDHDIKQGVKALGTK